MVYHHVPRNFVHKHDLYYRTYSNYTIRINADNHPRLLCITSWLMPQSRGDSIVQIVLDHRIQFTLRTSPVAKFYCDNWYAPLLRIFDHFNGLGGLLSINQNNLTPLITKDYILWPHWMHINASNSVPYKVF